MRAVVLLLFGLIIGVIGAILQAQRVHIGQFWIPTGLVLALGVLVPISRAAAWWLRSRLGAIYLGVGWLIGTLAMGTSSPWGDLILDSGIRQLSYLLIGSLLVTVAAALPLTDPASESSSELRSAPSSVLGPVSSTEAGADARTADAGGIRSRSTGPAASALDHPDA